MRSKLIIWPELIIWPKLVIGNYFFDGLGRRRGREGPQHQRAANQGHQSRQDDKQENTNGQDS